MHLQIHLIVKRSTIDYDSLVQTLSQIVKHVEPVFKVLEILIDETIPLLKVMRGVLHKDFDSNEKKSLDNYTKEDINFLLSINLLNRITKEIETRITKEIQTKNLGVELLSILCTSFPFIANDSMDSNDPNHKTYLEKIQKLIKGISEYSAGYIICLRQKAQNIKENTKEVREIIAQAKDRDMLNEMITQEKISKEKQCDMLQVVKRKLSEQKGKVSSESQQDALERRIITDLLERELEKITRDLLYDASGEVIIEVIEKASKKIEIELSKEVLEKSGKEGTIDWLKHVLKDLKIHLLEEALEELGIEQLEDMSKKIKIELSKETLEKSGKEGTIDWLKHVLKDLKIHLLEEALEELGIEQLEDMSKKIKIELSKETLEKSGKEGTIDWLKHVLKDLKIQLLQELLGELEIEQLEDMSEEAKLEQIKNTSKKIEIELSKETLEKSGKEGTIDWLKHVLKDLKIQLLQELLGELEIEQLEDMSEEAKLEQIKNTSKKIEIELSKETLEKSGKEGTIEQLKHVLEKIETGLSKEALEELKIEQPEDMSKKIEIKLPEEVREESKKEGTIYQLNEVLEKIETALLRNASEGLNTKLQQYICKKIDEEKDEKNLIHQTLQIANMYVRRHLIDVLKRTLQGKVELCLTEGVSIDLLSDDSGRKMMIEMIQGIIRETVSSDIDERLKKIGQERQQCTSDADGRMNVQRGVLKRLFMKDVIELSEKVSKELEIPLIENASEKVIRNLKQYMSKKVKIPLIENASEKVIRNLKQYMSKKVKIPLIENALEKVIRNLKQYMSERITTELLEKVSEETKKEQLQYMPEETKSMLLQDVETRAKRTIDNFSMYDTYLHLISPEVMSREKFLEKAAKEQKVFSSPYDVFMNKIIETCIQPNRSDCEQYLQEAVEQNLQKELSPEDYEKITALLNEKTPEEHERKDAVDSNEKALQNAEELIHQEEEERKRQEPRARTTRKKAPRKRAVAPKAVVVEEVEEKSDISMEITLHNGRKAFVSAPTHTIAQEVLQQLSDDERAILKKCSEQYDTITNESTDNTMYALDDEEKELCDRMGNGGNSTIKAMDDPSYKGAIADDIRSSVIQNLHIMLSKMRSEERQTVNPHNLCIMRPEMCSEERQTVISHNLRIMLSKMRSEERQTVILQNSDTISPRAERSKERKTPTYYFPKITTDKRVKDLPPTTSLKEQVLYIKDELLPLLNKILGEEEKKAEFLRSLGNVLSGKEAADPAYTSIAKTVIMILAVIGSLEKNLRDLNSDKQEIDAQGIQKEEKNVRKGLLQIYNRIVSRDQTKQEPVNEKTIKRTIETLYKSESITISKIIDYYLSRIYPDTSVDTCNKHEIDSVTSLVPHEQGQMPRSV